jgi:hypothetical protein
LPNQGAREARGDQMKGFNPEPMREAIVRALVASKKPGDERPGEISERPLLVLRHLARFIGANGACSSDKDLEARLGRWETEIESLANRLERATRCKPRK